MGADSAGVPRNGLLEIMVMARPTAKGGITFLSEDLLRAWAPLGTPLEVVPLKRLGDFHIDDGSGPWLRDRICITASETDDFAAENGGEVHGANYEQLFDGSGLYFQP